MKIVVFSDTHLTDQFDPQLYAALTAVIESADQVIINGDFWDGYLVTFEAFVTSAWNQLFPLLKSKQTVYLYGNHDPERLCDHRVSLFSVSQQLHYHFHQGQSQYYIQHGHQVYQSVVTNVSDYLPHGLVKLTYIWLNHHQQRDTLIGQLTARVEHYFDNTGDDRLRAYVDRLKTTQPNTWYIFGHTHTLNFSPHGGYLNPGRFTATTPGYLLIDQTVTLEGREWEISLV